MGQLSNSFTVDLRNPQILREFPPNSLQHLREETSTHIRAFWSWENKRQEKGSKQRNETLKKAFKSYTMKL